MKTIVLAVVGFVGSAIAQIFGGWTDAMNVLLGLMIIDYVTGMVLAGVFHKSAKTENGGLSSKVGWKGLFKKVATLVVVLVAHIIDILLGTGCVVRDAAVIAYCLNESISVLENCGAMGIPIPKPIKKAIDMLRQKAEAEESAAVEQGEAHEKELMK